MPVVFSIALVVSAITAADPTPAHQGDGSVAVGPDRRKGAAPDTVRTVKGKTDAGGNATAKKKGGKAPSQELPELPAEIRQRLTNPVWDTEFFVFNDPPVLDGGFVRFVALR